MSVRVRFFPLQAGQFANGLQRTMRRLFLVLAVSILSASATMQVVAQDEPTNKERPRRVLPTEGEPQDIIRIDTDLVPVDVTVTDAKGRLVRNLKKEDFKL